MLETANIKLTGQNTTWEDRDTWRDDLALVVRKERETDEKTQEKVEGAGTHITWFAP